MGHFIAGLFVGVIIGIFIMGLCAASGEDSRERERAEGGEENVDSITGWGNNS